MTDELAALTALLPAERQVDDLREQEAALLEQVHAVDRPDELAGAELTTLSTLVGELENASRPVMRRRRPCRRLRARSRTCGPWRTPTRSSSG